MKKQICHDCGKKEGQYHLPGCDMEVCPKCKGQIISCGCDHNKGFIMEQYFNTTQTCLRCGKKNPKFQMIGDEQWKFICGVTYPEDCILCVDCMAFITNARLSKNEGFMKQ